MYNHLPLKNSVWSSYRPPNLAKEASCRRRAIYPTVELTIFAIFFYTVPMHRCLFLLLLSIQSAHTNVLQKSVYQNLKYWSFYWTLNMTKIGYSTSFFFLSPHISVPPIFKHFIIWHANFCNTFVCAYWIEISNNNKHLCMGTV